MLAKTLDRARKTPGPGSIAVLTALENLAVLRGAQGRAGEAADFAREPLASVGHQDSNEITASEGADQRADNEHQRHRPSAVGYFSGHHCPGFVQR